MRRFLAYFEVILILTGLVSVGYCAYAWMESQAAQDRALKELAVMGRRAAGRNPPQEGSPVGEIVIPKVGLSAAILEGTEPATLRLAIGHVSGTAEPGETGNICLAGHRDTFFRPLKQISTGDEIELHFPGGTSRYRVADIKTVDPENGEVLEPTPGNTLTLITCYPFYFIGSAPKRFIVRAHAASNAPAAPAAPEQAAREQAVSSLMGAGMAATPSWPNLMPLPNPQGLLNIPERLYAWLLTDALNLLKVFVVALGLVKALRWSTAKLLGWQQNGRTNFHREQMVHTIVSVMNDVGTVTILAFAGMMALKDVNLDVRPLLAGAGVIGLAIGFGAQSLVKDLFHGVFIVLEDQYGIGDVIRVGTVTGQVERMTLRRTVVRDGEGTLITIPNGEVQVIGNLTRDWSQVSFSVAVGNRQRLEQVLNLLRDTIDKLSGDTNIKPDLLQQPQLLGVERFSGGQMEILLQVRTRPGRQADVGREWRRLIKLAFERADIPLTDPQDLRLVEHHTAEDSVERGSRIEQDPGRRFPVRSR